LAASFPRLRVDELRAQLASKRSLVRLQKAIDDSQQATVGRLGLAGITLQRENQRLYPRGAEAAHTLGYVNNDNLGVAGVERWLDEQGRVDRPTLTNDVDGASPPSCAGSTARCPAAQSGALVLSLDARAQKALYEELAAGLRKFSALAAAGLVMNVRTGEILAMVSLSSFDPYDANAASSFARLNRVVGATHDIVPRAATIAMGLESGKVALNSTFDVHGPLQVEVVTISESGQTRLLTVPEIFTSASSNGLAQIALLVGADYQRGFLDKLGLLHRVPIQLPDSADPVVPTPWAQATTALVALGRSLQITPLHVAVATSALTNGVFMIQPTVVKRSGDQTDALRPAVVGSDTSQKMRYMARLNTEVGGAVSADVKGYYVGGISGTLGAFDGVDDRLRCFVGGIGAGVALGIRTEAAVSRDVPQDDGQFVFAQKPTVCRGTKRPRSYLRI